MNLPNLNYKKTAIICCCMFFGGGFIFAYVIFPPILKFILRSQVILKPGTQMRDMYDALPFPLIFKVYLFHIENPDEVHEGGKPKLKEVGPFVFEEWKEKIDQVEDFDMDTLEFTERKTFIFSPELSAPLTGDEEVTLVHPLLSGIPLTVNVDRAPMLPLISKAIDLIFHEPKNMFWTGKAMDMLFNGIPIDCTSSDFNSKATCSVFEGGEIKAIQPAEEPDMFKFSLFGSANGTAGDRFKTYRGIKKLADLGRVIEFNEEPELDVWDGDECNEIRGTESSIFPPFKDKEEGVWAFEALICRSMQSTYDGKSKYSGLPTSHHIIDLGDIANDESMNCYCPDGECPLKGTMDLYPCVGTTLVASMPHFLHADPSLMENIASGLSPEKDKHIIYIDMETISGTPLSAAKRMQINLDLQPLEDIAYMQTVPEMVFPMLWVEEGANLNKTYVNMLKYQLFLGLKFRATVKWICLIVGGIGGIASTVIYFKQKKEQSTEVTKIPPTTNVEEADAPSGDDKKGDAESDDGSNRLNAVITSAQQRPSSRFDKAMKAMAIANDDNESQSDSISMTNGPASPATERAIMGSALERPLPESARADRAHLVSALRPPSISGMAGGSPGSAMTLAMDRSIVASAMSRQSAVVMGIAEPASLAGSAARPPSRY